MTVKVLGLMYPFTLTSGLSLRGTLQGSGDINTGNQNLKSGLSVLSSPQSLTSGLNGNPTTKPTKNPGSYVFVPTVHPKPG